MTTYGYTVPGRPGDENITRSPLIVPVTVLARKTAWGHDRVQITPVGGSGSRWVAADKLVSLELAQPLLPEEEESP